MAVLQRITMEKVSEYRAVRLRALEDSPTAFGSIYARENGFGEEEWEVRARNLDGVSAVGFMAFEEGGYRGLAICFPDEQDAEKAHLLSMWVAPECRRTGVGGLLVEAIAAWAIQRGARRLILMVTSSNEAAIEFYRRLGFSMTGRTEPYPNDAALVEYEMNKAIG